MRLYYTTVGEQNSLQNKPINSLGGYKSSSPVPNGSLNNLFGELSMNAIKNMRDEYIGLMLVNELGVTKNGVTIHFVYPSDSYSEYKIGANTPAVDGDGYNYIEQLPDRYSKPLYTDFVSAGVGNEFSIGTMLNGAMVGVWIKRELLESFIKSDMEDFYEPDPDNTRRYLAKTKSTQDDIQIVISWT